MVIRYLRFESFEPSGKGRRGGGDLGGREGNKGNGGVLKHRDYYFDQLLQ